MSPSLNNRNQLQQEKLRLLNASNIDTIKSYDSNKVQSISYISNKRHFEEMRKREAVAMKNHTKRFKNILDHYQKDVRRKTVEDPKHDFQKTYLKDPTLGIKDAYNHDLKI